METVHRPGLAGPKRPIFRDFKDPFQLGQPAQHGQVDPAADYPASEKALFGWHFFDCGSFSPVIVNPRPHSLGMVGRQEDLYLKPAVGWYLTC